RRHRFDWSAFLPRYGCSVARDWDGRTRTHRGGRPRDVPWHSPLPRRRDSPNVSSRLARSARVAQLDRVTASGAEGCGFDSRRAHHWFGNVSPLGSPLKKRSMIVARTDGSVLAKACPKTTEFAIGDSVRPGADY